MTKFLLALTAAAAIWTFSAVPSAEAKPLRAQPSDLPVGDSPERTSCPLATTARPLRAAPAAPDDARHIPWRATQTIRHVATAI